MLPCTFCVCACSRVSELGLVGREGERLVGGGRGVHCARASVQYQVAERRVCL